MTRNKRDCVTFSQQRKIKPSSRSITGYYAFRDTEHIAFESLLERDFIMRMEYMNTVSMIIPQPTKIPFTTNRRTYHYTPDFLVVMSIDDGVPFYDPPMNYLVEVKPESQWRENWRKWLPKWKAARRYAREEMGAEFRIFDESRIRTIDHQNIVFLQRYRKMVFPEEISQEIVESVKRMGVAPFDYLLSLHFRGRLFHEKAVGISHLWHLVATRRLTCDLGQPFHKQTELWVYGY